MKTKEYDDPVIIQCPECLDLNCAKNEICGHCGALLEREDNDN